MEKQEGFWYTVGDLFYKCFEGLEWVYDHLSPNKVLIVIGAACMIWWLLWQHRYNKEAAAKGTLK